MSSSARKMDVHFSSKRQDWATPQELFDEIAKRYGPFSIDVCATKENKKCPSYYGLDVGLDGLTAPWHVNGLPGPKCWMNPPYGREIGKWVRKAYEESLKGCTVVCLLPARVDTKWFHQFCYKNENAVVSFLEGRVRFEGATAGAPFPSMIVVFRHPSGGVR